MDLRVSLAGQQLETDLKGNGYVQLLMENSDVSTKKVGGKPAQPIVESTFTNKHSIWIWRRSQGTCSGRLKPIVDIHLESVDVSTEMVLSGYTCDPLSINGQWYEILQSTHAPFQIQSTVHHLRLWIKRAATAEEEKDAIVELDVTVGKIKNPVDEIWNSPGVGWIRVDGNFTKSMFGGVDTFL